MSDQPSERKSACPHPEAVGKRWGDPISDDRKAELKRLAATQESEPQPGFQDKDAQSEVMRKDKPFSGVALTGADVFFLAVLSLVGPSGDPEQVEEQLHPAGGHGLTGREPILQLLHLDGANLQNAHLEEAFLVGAHFSRADFRGAHLEGSFLIHTFLDNAWFQDAHLEGAALSSARLKRTHFEGAHMERADLSNTHLERADFFQAHLESADFSLADLERADLRRAHSERAVLLGAHLDGANLNGAHLEGASLFSATLNGKTDLTQAFFDSGTILGDIRWGGVGTVDLTQTSWTNVARLGDETTLKRGSMAPANDKAARAYRQVAAQLRAQGMNEVSDRFLYRAQVCHRRSLRRQGITKWPSYVGSLLLDALAGYGFRPGRSILVYLAVIVWFANFYVWATHGVFALGLPPSQFQPLAWYEALVLSVSSFHGRGFLPFPNLGDPVTILAAIEAIFGLIIEVSFIATFTNRFFAR